MLHRFITSITDIPLPERFTYPFCYTPHPLCMLAAGKVQDYLSQQKEWEEELKQGKMFGVLVVRTSTGEIGYLAAFSGILAGKNVHPFFVPPVYDLLQPEGFFKVEEEQISQINMRIRQLEEAEEYREMIARWDALQREAEEALNEAKSQMKAAKEKREERRKSASSSPERGLSAEEATPESGLSAEEEAALIRESQFQKAEYKRLERTWKEQINTLQNEVSDFETKIQQLKAERKTRSAALQQQLFEQFKMLNSWGEVKTLCEIFGQTVHKTPPAGAGECAAPKLLQQAYLHDWEPIAMAEFWWGASPKTEIRHHGHYYPACKGKCEPILQHMLQGLRVEENPLLKSMQCAAREPEIVYEDSWLVVVNKPAGMLSVPGKEAVSSVYSLMQERYPDADGPMIVHRLDMATSGLMIVAKAKRVHQHLQAQFKSRLIKKRYIALLDGIVPQDRGTIELPLCLNPLDRPRQIVDAEHGKPAVTDFQVLERAGGHTRIAFYPRTGRTHQLRVHAAHVLGLHCPIIGDELYGKKADRLYLHAESLEFIHPITEEKIMITQEARFITQPTPQDYDELLSLWEASVRSTHHFLSEDDIRFYKPLVRNEYLPAVELFIIRNPEGKIAAFMGLSQELVEMLFVHPAEQGKGYGKQLMEYALHQKHIYKVDVNEQNEQAHQFYRHIGFKVTGRDATDATGKPFPILHLLFKSTL